MLRATLLVSLSISATINVWLLLAPDNEPPPQLHRAFLPSGELAQKPPRRENQESFEIKNDASPGNPQSELLVQLSPSVLDRARFISKKTLKLTDERADLLGLSKPARRAIDQAIEALSDRCEARIESLAYSLNNTIIIPSDKEFIDNGLHNLKPVIENLPIDRTIRDALFESIARLPRFSGMIYSRELTLLDDGRLSVAQIYHDGSSDAEPKHMGSQNYFELSGFPEVEMFPEAEMYWNFVVRFGLKIKNEKQHSVVSFINLFCLPEYLTVESYAHHQRGSPS